MNDKDFGQMIHREFEQLKSDSSSEEQILKKIKGEDSMSENKKIKMTSKADNSSAIIKRSGGIIAAAAVIAVCMGIGLMQINLKNNDAYGSSVRTENSCYSKALEEVSSNSQNLKTEDEPIVYDNEVVSEIKKLISENVCFDCGNGKFIVGIKRTDVQTDGDKTIYDYSFIYRSSTTSYDIYKGKFDYFLYNMNEDKIERRIVTECWNWMSQNSQNNNDFFVEELLYDDNYNFEGIHFERYDYELNKLSDLRVSAEDLGIPNDKYFGLCNYNYSLERDKIFLFCGLGEGRYKTPYLYEISADNSSSVKAKKIFSFEKGLYQSVYFSADSQSLYYLLNNTKHGNVCGVIDINGTDTKNSFIPIDKIAANDNQSFYGYISNNSYLISNSEGNAVMLKKSEEGIKRIDFKIDMKETKQQCYAYPIDDDHIFFIVSDYDETEEYGVIKFEDQKARVVRKRELLEEGVTSRFNSKTGEVIVYCNKKIVDKFNINDL